MAVGGVCGSLDDDPVDCVNTVPFSAIYVASMGPELKRGWSVIAMSTRERVVSKRQLIFVDVAVSVAVTSHPERVAVHVVVVVQDCELCALLDRHKVEVMQSLTVCVEHCT